MVNVDQIRVLLQQVVMSEISVDAFDEWISGASWNMHKESSVDAQKLVGKIELLLSDFDNGFLADQDLKGKLSELIPYFVIAPKAQLRITTGATGEFSSQPVWLGVFDRSPAKAPVYTPILQVK